MSKLREIVKKNPALSWVLGFQIFRFLLLPFMGLMPQDAYYYLYGQNLSLSYFDHPGMIGYILRFFSELFGQSVYVVKLADFTITSLTILSFYKLASCFLSQHRVWKSMALMVSTVFITILSFNSTPDVPLILFWSLSVLFLYRAIFQQKKWYWIWAGLAMGLAFNSKYTALLLQIGLIAFVVFSNKYRKLLLSPFFWICLILSVAVTFPVWWWNYQNDFASFAFQSSDRTDSISKFEFKASLFFGTLAHQLLLLLPTLFFLFLLFSFKHIKKVVTKFKLPNSETLFLLAFFVPTFVGFLLISPIYWVKLNWMMPSYVTGVILAAMYAKRKLIKAHLITSVVIHLALVVQIVFYVVPVKSDDTWVGWKELSNEVENLKKEYSNAFVFSADGYKTSAVLNFYLDEKVYGKNIIGLPALHFDYLGDDLGLLNGRNAIYIDSDKRFKNSDKRNEILPVELKQYFNEIVELEPIIIKKGNREIRKFWVYHCKSYRLAP